MIQIQHIFIKQLKQINNFANKSHLLLHPFNGFFQDNLGKPTPER